MKWLPRDKQVPFFAVVVTTIAVLFIIYFFLIRAQHASLSKLITSKDVAQNQLKTFETMVVNSDARAEELAEVIRALSKAEGDMASGDLVFWTYDTMRRFKQQYKVEIPDVSRPAVSDVDFLPSFPYKQLRFSISGAAYYHDLGKFISDFENNFPHARIINLGIESQPGSLGEKISFRMQIVALVKPNPS